jgi:hypothetical protein
MTRFLSGFVCSLVVSLAACGAATAPSSDPKAVGSSPDPKATCVAVFQKQRACTDTYIPALVDERVKLDWPAGIAAAAKEPGGRDALIAQAREEWKTDSQDDSINAVCDRMLASPNGATDEMVDQGNACVAKSSCDEFTACVMPLVEANLQQHMAAR